VKVGVLAIQGDFAAHARALARVAAEPVAVRTPGDLASLDALVLPGGESSAMLRGIERDALEAPLRAFLASGRRVLGTCAGAILLARRVSNPVQRSFGALDIDMVRNAYGSQLDSFESDADTGGAYPALHCVFIRAPRIARVGPGVEVLARVRGDAVLVREGPIWASTFHPELGADDRVVRDWLGA
jgi:5'-phosphate synthase pdxT subunit